MIMAKVEFEGFVEDVVSGQSGVFGLKTAETHRRKNESGEYETTARTFRTVKASRDTGVSFDGFSKGDRVKVTGTEKTEVREWQGKKLYDLVCWADSVMPVGTSEPAGEPWAPREEPTWFRPEQETF